jgi:hypothetical protein
LRMYLPLPMKNLRHVACCKRNSGIPHGEAPEVHISLSGLAATIHAFSSS